MAAGQRWQLCPPLPLLLLLLLLSPAAWARTLQAAAAAPVTTAPYPLPSWARLRAPNLEDSDPDLLRNQAIVAVNREQRLDIVVYGDSITHRIGAKYAAEWYAAFGRDEEGRALRTATLGLGGSTVEELAYRLMSGDERLHVPPRVAIILIGINNDPSSQPALREHLASLLFYLTTLWPHTRLILLAPLPSIRFERSLLLPGMWGEVARGLHAARTSAGLPGVIFSQCGALLDPYDPLLFPDGLHPAGPAYERIFACLRPVVLGALAESRADSPL